VIAAILHLDEGARLSRKSLDQMRRAVSHRHDVVDDRLRRVGDGESSARLRPARRG